MSELEAFLKKIKESEASGVEKHRKITSYETLLKDLNSRYEEESEEVKMLKKKVENEKSSLLTKKIDKGQIMINIAAKEEMLRKKSAMAETLQRERLQSLQDLSDMMDRVAEDNRVKVRSFSLAADPEVVMNRKRIKEEEIEKEEKLKNDLELECKKYEQKIYFKKSLQSQLDDMYRDIEGKEKMKSSLIAEADELMTELNSVMEMTGKDSDLKVEVRSLQNQLSILMQEGKLPKDDLLALKPDPDSNTWENPPSLTSFSAPPPPPRVSGGEGEADFSSPNLPTYTSPNNLPVEDVMTSQSPNFEDSVIMENTNVAVDSMALYDHYSWRSKASAQPEQYSASDNWMSTSQMDFSLRSDVNNPKQFKV